MLTRFVVMLATMIGALPFVAAYLLSLNDPGHDFVVDVANWRLGLVPICLGFLAFFLPVLIPGAGEKYCKWALAKLGVLDLLVSGSVKAKSFISSVRRSFVKEARSANEQKPQTSRGSWKWPDISRFKSSKTSVADMELRESLTNSAFIKSLRAMPIRDQSVGMFNRFVESFKPEALDQTLALNSYTLDVFPLTRSCLEDAITFMEVNDMDREFVLEVLSGLPQRPSTPEATPIHNTKPFQYPLALRDEIVEAGRNHRIYVDDATFSEADAGDIRSALTIVSVIFKQASTATRPNDDPLVMYREEDGGDALSTKANSL